MITLPPPELSINVVGKNSYQSLYILSNQQDKIVVFQAYDTVVEANLAKTKLDAFGVPCFLTDEHLTTLYPIRNDIFPGVRLYIFEKDTELAKEILTEANS